MNIIEKLAKPIILGGKTIPNRLILAPMAGLTHIAFRALLDEIGGCGLMYMEMCGATALPTENRSHSPVFKWRDEEAARLVCQIVGSEPDIMAKAAERIEKEGFFGVDLNFGCSVAAICKKNSGADVLRDPDRAVAIVEAVRASVSIPLSVKFRTGWEDDPEKAALLGQRMEKAGADFFIFHPRVAPDRRTRPPKMGHIRILKEAVNIPVFGNGDVFTRQDCHKMLETTGCDGIALGRAAIAKPWIFNDWVNGIDSGPEIYLRTAMRLTYLLEEYNEPVRSVRLFKKWAVYFAASFVYGHSIRPKLCKGENMDEIRKNLMEILDPAPEISERPSTHLFTV